MVLFIRFDTFGKNTGEELGIGISFRDKSVVGVVVEGTTTAAIRVCSRAKRGDLKRPCSCVKIRGGAGAVLEIAGRIICMCMRISPPSNVTQNTRANHAVGYYGEYS